MVKQKITKTTIIQRNNDIFTSNLDGEKVMLSIKRGEYYGLTKTGSFIWDNIEKPVKIADLIDILTTKYHVNKDQCLIDIIPFIIDLIEKDLILKKKA